MGKQLLLALGMACAASAGLVLAEENVPGNAEGQASATGDRAMSGMSIVGNQEAPKALVIVPWKSSEMGAGMGLSRDLDDLAAPVDKEVFARALGYHRIRAGSEE